MDQRILQGRPAGRHAAAHGRAQTGARRRMPADGGAIDGCDPAGIAVRRALDGVRKP